MNNSAEYDTSLFWGENMKRNNKIFDRILLSIMCILLILCGCANQEPVETEALEPCITDGIVYLSEGGPYIFSRYLTASERVEADYLFETNTTCIYITNNGNAAATVELNFEEPRQLAPFVMNIAPGETKYFNNLVGSCYYRLYFQQAVDGEMLIEITD